MPAPPEESDPAIVSAMGVSATLPILITRSLLRSAALHDLRAEILRRHHLLDAAQRGEIVEQPTAEPVDRAGEEQEPGQHEESAHRLLHLVEVAAKLLHEPEERPYGHGGKDEGNTEAKRIDGEQLHARRQAPLVGREREHRRQDRAYARRPAEGKGKTDD